MRIFASDRVSSLMQKLGMQEGEAIEHPWVTRAIENAQRKVESYNFDIRKQLLEYDDVANDQRRVIYEQRNELLEAEDISDTVKDIRREVANDFISQYIPPNSLDEQWDVPGLERGLKQEYGLELPVGEWLEADDSLHEEPLRERIVGEMERVYAEKERLAGERVMREFEKAVMLQILDSSWKDHLAAMDHLRQGIHLRGYAQKNPKQEYKREAFEMFTAMLERIKQELVAVLARVEVAAEEDVQAVEEQRRSSAPMAYQHQETSALAAGGGGRADVRPPLATQPYVREGRKVGRNEPCPCGSGKKYKQCHGKLS